jgi:hypothetical protein
LRSRWEGSLALPTISLTLWLLLVFLSCPPSLIFSPHLDFYCHILVPLPRSLGPGPSAQALVCEKAPSQVN